MIEALWSVEFNAGSGYVGRGVVIFEHNRVVGGDLQYYYLGTYSVQDQRLNATVSAVYYDQEEAPFSVFGTDEQTIELLIAGQVGEHVITASGHRAEDPSKQIMIRLTRRAELPNPAPTADPAP